MKIGLFTDSYVPQVNGVSTVVGLMVREFERAGHEALVFAPAYPQAPPGQEGKVFRFRSRSVRFHPESRLTWPVRRGLSSLVGTLDVVHSHTPFSLGLLALWVARRAGVPHVHTYHTYFTEYLHYLPRALRPSKRLAERVSRAFCNRCDWVLAPSEEMRAQLVRYGIQTPIETLPFGIDLESFRGPVRLDLRAALHLPATASVLLSAGRLGLEKNFGFLLEVLARVKPEVPGVVLVLAGDGPAREELERQAAELELDQAVRFLGYVEREALADYYRQADLFVFASKTETQGIVLLEAQAAGTPVVAVGAMGVPAVVDHGRGGLLVPEERSAFAQAVVRVLRDEEERRRLSRGALDWVAAHGADRSCRDLIALYRRLRERPRVVRSRGGFYD